MGVASAATLVGCAHLTAKSLGASMVKGCPERDVSASRRRWLTTALRRKYS